MTQTSLRRAFTATLVVLAALATFLVVAPAASAAVTVDNAGAALSATDVYEGDGITVAPGTIRCDGAPYSGWLDVLVDGTLAGTTYVSAGYVTPFMISVNLNDHPLGDHPIVGHPSTYCPGGNPGLHFGTFTTHTRDTTTTIATPATVTVGETTPVTVTVENTGPETPTGSVNVAVDGTAVPTGPLVDGAVTFDWEFQASEPHISALYLPAGPWASSSNNVVVYVTPETPNTAVFSTPSSAATGSNAKFSVMTEAAIGVDVTHMDDLTLTIDGVPAAPFNSGITGGGDWAMSTFFVSLAGVAPGTRTLTATLPAKFPLAASSVSWDLEVTAMPHEITASGPTQARWGDFTTVSVDINPDGADAVDGTVTVYDGATVVGSAPASRGLLTIALSGVGVGENRELTITHDGGTMHAPATTTFTLDVLPAAVNVDITVVGTVAGANSAVTVTANAATPGLTPTGTVHWEMDGFVLPGFDPAETSSAGWNLVARASTITYTAVYTSDRPEFADARVTKTHTYARAATTTTADLTYTAPGAPDTTGAVTGSICVIADEATVFPSSYGTDPLELALTDNDTLVTQHATATTSFGAFGCIRTAPFSAADLAPGEYTLTVTYPGNAIYMEPSSDTFTFTVERAPTGMALVVSGAPGDTFGMSTLVRATLTDPVPGHAHNEDITFLVDGEPVATVTPTDGIATTYLQLPAGDGIEVTATYPGDTMHTAAAAAPLHFDVAQGTVTVDVSAAPERVLLGETSTLTATVTADDAPPPLLGVHAPNLAPAAAAAVGDPATGTVTFHVDGVPVGTETLVNGAASMPYTLDAGTHAITASYSGSASFAPVAAEDVASATAIADPPVVTPPAVPTPPAAPVPPTFPPATPAATPGGSTVGITTPAEGSRSAANMAHTGGEARTLVTLGAVLLAAGLAVLQIRRRGTR